jgi:hypothetical protein
MLALLLPLRPNKPPALHLLLPPGSYLSILFFNLTLIVYGLCLFYLFIYLLIIYLFTYFIIILFVYHDSVQVC